MDRIIQQFLACFERDIHSLLPRTRTMRFPWSLDQRGRLLAPLLASAQNTDVLLDLIKTYRQDQRKSQH